MSMIVSNLKLGLIANQAWHPLMKFIMAVKSDYFRNVINDHLAGYMGLTEYEERINNYNFNDWLHYLANIYEEYRYADVFRPLYINCYNGLALFKYKGYIELADLGYDFTNFWELHNGLYRECRSVVIDLVNNELVLAPQSKFDNIDGGMNGWDMSSIRDRISNSKKVEITNKLDGSNQNYRWYHGEVVGSGSQALDIKESWRLKRGYQLLNKNYIRLLQDNPDYTFMFEFISPDNPIVVHYTKEQEGLYLFGARNVNTGKELSYEKIIELSNLYDVKCTDIYNDTLDDILGKVDDYNSNEKEGWVINIIDKDTDENFKAKLKVTDYLLMHKAITKMVSPNAIIEALRFNRYDDFFAKIPIAYREQATKTANNIIAYVKYLKNQSEGYFLASPFSRDRKTFMIWVDQNVPKRFAGYVKNLYLNKPVDYFDKLKNSEVLNWVELQTI